MNGGERWVLGAWLATVAAITVRGIAKQQDLPQPNSYLAAGVVFTMLYGLAGFAPGLGAVAAVGTVIGVVAAPYFKGQQDGGVLGTVTGWLEQIGGTQQQQQPQQSAARPVPAPVGSH